MSDAPHGKDGDKKKTGTKAGKARKPRPHQSKQRPFIVVYEDADLLVANKAPGILTVPIPDKSSKNLKELLDDYLVRQKRFLSHQLMLLVVVYSRRLHLLQYNIESTLLQRSEKLFSCETYIFSTVSDSTVLSGSTNAF